MSTIKISELPDIPGGLNANTSNSLFLGVDIPTGVTGKFTATQLADRLYANNTLVVGTNPVALANVVAQFSGVANPFLQTNLQNFDANGSADHVITGDLGTDTTYFIDMGIQGSELHQGILDPLDGYLVIAGEEGNDVGGNLIIGTTTPGKNMSVTLGGYEDANVVAQFIYNTGFKLTTKPLYFADGTSQNTAAATAAYTQAGFLHANSAFGGQNTTGTYANSAFLKANSAYSSQNTTGTYANSGFAVANSGASYANSAFTKANNALANSSGTFAGNLTIAGNTVAQLMNTGNLVVVGTTSISGNTDLAGILNVVGAVNMNATLVLANSNFTASESAITIKATANVATPSNDGYMIHITGKNGVASRVVSDSYGTGAYSLYAGRTARGNVDYPSAVQTGDIITRISGNGFGTTKFQTLGTGRIDILAAENFTDANTGTQIKFWNCAVGSNTLTNILTLNGDSATFSGTVSPEKGFIYTPRVPAGNQTAITISYSTDSLIRANLVADLTVSHSNFTAGKVVEMWLTNTDNSNHTITHGCAALRSTNKSTTATITAGSSMYLKFFSVDGDLANTYVSING